MPHLFVLTGPPAVGKSTVAGLLARHLIRSVVIPVDDFRLFVRTGLSESVPWTDETERQFQLAERAVMETSRVYLEGGFDVILDHCRNLPRWNAILQEANLPFAVTRVLLLPRLDENLDRNQTRTHKPFGPEVLVDTIRFTHRAFTEANHRGWKVIDNSELSPEETVLRILGE